MTKKDFEMIASVLKACEWPSSNDTYAKGMRCQWSNTIDAFASALASQNPRFDRARFLAACGME